MAVVTHNSATLRFPIQSSWNLEKREHSPSKLSISSQSPKRVCAMKKGTTTATVCADTTVCRATRFCVKPQGGASSFEEKFYIRLLCSRWATKESYKALLKTSHLKKNLFCSRIRTQDHCSPTAAFQLDVNLFSARRSGFFSKHRGPT